VSSPLQQESDDAEFVMKPTYSAMFNRPNSKPKVFTGLSERQLVQTMLEQGIHTLSSITHGERSGKVQPVEGQEMISIWKQVYRSSVARKH
jgi:hypothetical protein